MQKKAFALGLLLVTLTLAGPAAPTASALRCGGKLIDKGNTEAEVRKSCGEPTCIREPTTRFVERAGIYWPLAADEEWVYNRGPGRFVRLIRFYEGKVVDIRSGDYGWSGDRDCPEPSDP